MTDDGTTTPDRPNPEGPDDPEDQHLDLITALVKIFATDRGDTSTEPPTQRPG